MQDRTLLLIGQGLMVLEGFFLSVSSCSLAMFRSVYTTQSIKLNLPYQFYLFFQDVSSFPFFCCSYYFEKYCFLVTYIKTSHSFYLESMVGIRFLSIFYARKWLYACCYINVRKRKISKQPLACIREQAFYTKWQKEMLSQLLQGTEISKVVSRRVLAG